MQFCYQNIKAVGQTQAELHSLKFEKLDAYIRPFFANSATFSDIETFAWLSLFI